MTVDKEKEERRRLRAASSVDVGIGIAVYPFRFSGCFTVGPTVERLPWPISDDSHSPLPYLAHSGLIGDSDLIGDSESCVRAFRRSEGTSNVL